MPTGVNDTYANIASATVVANGTTLAFAELQTGISLGQGVGIIIDQIDYYYNRTGIGVLADNEEVVMAWTTSNTLTDLLPTNSRVIHVDRLGRTDFGTAAAGTFKSIPVERKFTPPMIVAAPRIYLAIGAVASITQNFNSRIYYRYIKLSAQEYLELAEAFVLVG